MENELKLAKEKEVMLKRVIDKHKRNIKEYKKTVEAQDALIKNHKKTITDLNYKIEELDNFKITMLDHTVHQLAEQEELIIKLQESLKHQNRPGNKHDHNSDEIHTFGGTSFSQDIDQNKPHVDVKPVELLYDFEPVSGYMRALTNEVVYLYDEVDHSTVKNRPQVLPTRSIGKNKIPSTKQIDPKTPQSPIFYSSSDVLNNTTLQGVSSKDLSSNTSQRKAQESTSSEVTFVKVNRDNDKENNSMLFQR